MKIHHKAAIILFLEGLASAGLQMIAIRQSIPFVGHSILSTSIIISIFMAALALGYYYGGKQHHNKFHKKLITNLLASLVLFGIGLSYPVVNKFFLSLAELTGGMGMLANPLLHLFCFCLVIMGPLVFFLAQTVPLLLNTASEETTKSAATGNATALSTIGNVVGCLLTSLVFMYIFGIGLSIFFNTVMLAACLIFLLDWKETRAYTTTIFTLCCLIVTYFVNVKVPGEIFQATTPYSNIQVSETNSGKRLIINRSNASFISNDGTKGWQYIEIIKDGIFSDPNIAGKDILVLGSGGFSLSAEGTHGANFYYLDIDHELKEIAERHFLKSAIKGKFIAQDARNYLLTSEKKRWDYIILDLYSNASTIPAHTSTIEFFELISSRLKVSGKAILNIVANPQMNDRYSVKMDNTIRSALSRCVTDITEYENKLVNIVYFCASAENHPEIPQELKVAGLYEDDRSDVTVDAYLSSMSARRWTDH